MALLQLFDDQGFVCTARAMRRHSGGVISVRPDHHMALAALQQLLVGRLRVGKITEAGSATELQVLLPATAGWGCLQFVLWS